LSSSLILENLLGIDSLSGDLVLSKEYHPALGLNINDGTTRSFF